MADLLSSSTRELVTLGSQTSNLTDGDSDYEELPSPYVDGEDTEDAVHKEGQRIRSFNCIHGPPLAFKDPNQKMMIPGVPVNLKIVDIERSPATHLLNPNLYVLQLQHGPYEWTIKKRYKHFQHLHQQLLLFRTALSIPLPTKRHKERRRTCRRTERKRLPRFPRKPEALVPQDSIPQRAQQLEDYLQSVLKTPMYRNHHEMMSFLEVSPFSFVHALGAKYKEGVVQKRSGGHRASVGCFRLKRTIIDWCGHWRWRWLIIKDTWLAYVNPKDGRIRCVLLMDGDFQVECGFLDTGIHHGLQVSNSARHLLIRCFTHRRAREWYECLLNVSKHTGQDFTLPNRYGSFVPMRMNSNCRWFVDGATYFEAVADALEQAREEIFIADWWLSPELYMKRPVIQGEIWRLDYILQRKATQGVKVFILLYKEVELALGINSLYSKQQLVHMHPNIKVLRHPDHVTGGTLFWAHHEKIVCIDQNYAFLGGIDLCYGRWDDHQHRLSDLAGICKSLSPDSFDLKTSSTPRGTPMMRRSHSTSDIANDESIPNFKEWKNMRLSLLSQPPPPIHVTCDTVDDAGIEILVHSPTPHSSQIIPPSSPPEHQENSTSDGLKVPYFHFHKAASPSIESGKKKYIISRKLKAKRVMQAVGHLQALNKRMRNKSLESLDSGWDSLDLPSTNLRRTASEVALSKLGLEGQPKMWIGKDYINFIVKDFEHLHKPYQDLVDRHTTPRMPWHDIGAFVQGAAARDVARHFIQRWNFTKFEKAKYYDRYPWLLPKSYEDVENIRSLQLNTTSQLFCANCQVIRSIGTWSAGAKTVEQSIHTAYLHAIENASHYIYIENQFFISQSSGHKDVFNGICDALYKRIVRAHKSKSCFRVYVCMPLLPAFEGEIGTDSGVAIQAITHWNYASICRGPNSLWQRLALEVGDPSNYITFYGLRNHGMINDKLTTELVYIHSKLMIVDDCIAIIGSANINDRSMLGDRDSEIGIIVTDVDFDPSIMNGKTFESGRFAGSLRRTIFREHLGLIGTTNANIDIRDPVKESFYKEVWIRTAALNSSVFEKVFRCIPSDEVRNFAQLRNHFTKPCMATTDPDGSKELLATVRGHLVLLPLQFLCEESLTPAAGTKESLMPVCLWT